MKLVSRVFQSLEDGAPQARLVGSHQVALGRAQAEGSMQVQQQVQRLVVGSVQAIPRPRRLQARRVLGEEGALTVAERGAEQGQAAATAGGLCQSLQQARARQGLVRQRWRAKLTRVD